MNTWNEDMPKWPTVCKGWNVMPHDKLGRHHNINYLPLHISIWHCTDVYYVDNFRYGGSTGEGFGWFTRTLP